MLGWTPRQLDEVTLQEFHAALDGYERAHSTPDAKPPSDADHDALVEKYRHLDF